MKILSKSKTYEEWENNFYDYCNKHKINPFDYDIDEMWYDYNN